MFPSLEYVVYGVFGLWLAWKVVLVIYRLTLHPLAGFPGPKIAAATRLYEFYYDVIYGGGSGGHYYREIELMHAQYGPIVRVTPEELHIKDPDYFSVLYAGGSARRDKHKDIAHIIGRQETSFGAQDFFLHKSRRAAVAPMFSRRSVDNAQELVWKEVELLSKNLEDRLNNGVTEIFGIMLAFATDTVCIFTKGRSAEFQKNPEQAKLWREVIESLMQMTPLVRKFPALIDLANSMPSFLIRRLSPKLSMAASQYTDAFSEASQYLKSQSRNENKDIAPSRTTIYREIEESNLSPSEKSLERMAHEGKTTVEAGASTTALTLTHAVYFILSHQSVLEKLRDELSAVYPNRDSKPSLASAQELPYLTAVIKECMRLHAVFTSRLPLLPHTELEYGKWKIPPMTPVSLTIHDVLMDPRVFEDPTKFIPERWINNGEKSSRYDRYFVPFSRGSRMCLGMELAMAEIYLAISTIFRRFDLELYDTEWKRDVEINRDCFVGLPRKGSRGVRVKVAGLRD